MSTIGPSPFVWLPFDKQGELEAGAHNGLAAALTDPLIEELVVISHGWKNEKDDAWKLYSALWSNVVATLQQLNPQKIVVAGVQWPAKRYPTSVDSGVLARNAGNAGGVLAALPGEAVRDLNDREFEDALEAGLQGLNVNLNKVRSAVAAFTALADPDNARALVDAALAGGIAIGGDTELEPERASLLRAASNPDDVLQTLAMPPDVKVVASAGKPQGIVDSIGSLFAGPRAAVIRLLEQLSYFEMKKRAGIVGAALGHELNALDPGRPLRLHLVGHSFGARVVTAAAAAIAEAGPLDLFSLTLLQGAFSHNALSVERGGYFSKVVGKPSGPIAITHTHNDWACTRVYALASRLSRDNVSAVGDRNDAFGAMGGNGAQFGPGEPDGRSAVQSSATQDFKPDRNKITNFLADAYINDPLDAHNDVTNSSVAALIAASLEA